MLSAWRSFHRARRLRSRPVAWALLAALALAVPAVAVDGEDRFDAWWQLSPDDAAAGELQPARKTYWLSYHSQERSQKYLEWLWKDPVNLVTRPAYWRGGEWTTFGIEAGITGALLPLDDSVRDLFQDNHSASVDSALNTIRDATGAGATFFAAGAVMFGSGLIVHNEKLADSGFLAFESVVYAGALAQGIKFLTGRERPDVAKDQYQFHGPGSGSNTAFVSGEGAVAFAFASSVSEVWQNPWVSWPLYTLAGAVSAQRITSNKHWLSDVVGGAFLGHVVGQNLVRFHYRHDRDGVLRPYVTRDT